MTLLMRIITGSYLYGVAVPGKSDVDVKEIYDYCKPSREMLDGNVELVRWPLNMLMKVADRGGHNGLELLMVAPDWPEVDLLRDFRLGHRTNYYLCLPRFRSAQKTLEARQDEKGFMRSQMLEDWLQQIGRTGRFNPHWKIQQ